MKHHIRLTEDGKNYNEAYYTLKEGVHNQTDLGIIEGLYNKLRAYEHLDLTDGQLAFFEGHDSFAIPDGTAVDALPPERELDPCTAEFQKAAEPLVDFLYRYGNPHSSAVVTQADAELFSGEIGVKFPLRD